MNISYDKLFEKLKEKEISKTAEESEIFYGYACKVIKK